MMSLLDKLLRRKPLIIEVAPPTPQAEPVIPEVATPLVDGLFLPKGCAREGDVLIVLPEFSKQWFDKEPDKREAVKQMLAFLKQQYPAVGNFQIRK